ncbi:MAG: hypothetical protein ACJATT_003267 [Myxococcota bacterium]
MSDLPTDWREQMVQMIRGTRPLDGTWFRGGPVLSPTDQIEVYANQYRLRLPEAVIYELRGLDALLGDALPPLVAQYLNYYPSQTWTLDRVADQFEHFLASINAPVVQIDMARLDIAVSRAFTASEPQTFDTTTLRAETKLVLQPPVQLLELSTSVFRTRSASLSGVDIPELEFRDFRVVVFRPERKIRHLVLAHAAYQLLQVFKSPTSLADGLQTFSNDAETTNALAANLGDWMRTFAASRILGPPG